MLSIDKVLLKRCNCSCSFIVAPNDIILLGKGWSREWLVAKATRDHYLNNWRPITSEVLWHSPGGITTWNTQKLSLLWLWKWLILNYIRISQGPILLTWFKFNPDMEVITSITKCGMKLLSHSQTLMVQPEWISNFIRHFPMHVIDYLSMLGLKLNNVSKRGLMA